MRERLVAAIVPALNEEERVAATISALRSISDVGEVFVIDDGSTDETVPRAAAAGARAYRLNRRVGKGAALAFGASRTQAPVLLFVDADLAETARETRRLLETVMSGSADVAIATLPRRGSPSGFGLVEGFARWGIRVLTGRVMEQPLSGQRALRREVLDAIPRLAVGFGVEPAMTVDALRAGFRVIEVPCEMDHARTGRNVAGFAHRARQGIDVAAALLGRAARRRVR